MKTFLLARTQIGFLCALANDQNLKVSLISTIFSVNAYHSAKSEASFQKKILVLAQLNVYYYNESFVKKVKIINKIKKKRTYQKKI